MLPLDIMLKTENKNIEISGRPIQYKLYSKLF